MELLEQVLEEIWEFLIEQILKSKRKKVKISLNDVSQNWRNFQKNSLCIEKVSSLLKAALCTENQIRIISAEVLGVKDSKFNRISVLLFNNYSGICSYFNAIKLRNSH